MQKWEYNVTRRSAHKNNFSQPNAEMDEAGREGWELVSATYLQDDDEHSFVCVYKRPVHHTDPIGTIPSSE